ncbi:hypothetical protein JXB37_04955 [candidate division WOR-3 bacterium]|nr:hypothetical protein [candidate division WOR-3 bacterium]
MEEKPQQPAAPAPQPAVPVAPGPGVPCSAKPSQVQTLGILTLISGILNCMIGVGLMFTVIWILPAVYGIVVGILEIIYATKLMPDPIKVCRPNKTLAILEIITIINGSIFGLVVGILALVWYNDLKVKEYFDSQPAV